MTDQQNNAGRLLELVGLMPVMVLPVAGCLVGSINISEPVFPLCNIRIIIPKS